MSPHIHFPLLSVGGWSPTVASPSSKVLEDTDDGDKDHDDTDDWYCIKAQMRCGCGRDYPYVSVAHLIIVWTDKDDEHLLFMCQALVERGYKPKIKPYEDSMGPCVSWYAIDARGLQPCT